MPALGPRPVDPGSRTIRRILVLLGIAGVLIAVWATHVGLTYYRMHQHKERFLASIQEVSTEAAEREALREEARRRLSSGDFDWLDATAREYRDSRATFGEGTWKLSTLHQGLAGSAGEWSEREWMLALEQARRWTQERPKSITARIALIELWIGYALAARGDGWSQEVTPDRWAVYEQRIGEAAQVASGLASVEERSPRRATSLMWLALNGAYGKEEEAKLFADAIRDDPDYQPNYSLHLRFLLPRWHGAPGELEAAARAIAARPGGKERLARAMWQLDAQNAFETRFVPWPTLRQGFAELHARHPESFEIQSAACHFASYYADAGETKRLFVELGSRMEPEVWKSREAFVRAYHWATFEDGEVAGGDPLARFFAWVMGS
jgi:hypothetical protein